MKRDLTHTILLVGLMACGTSAGAQAEPSIVTVHDAGELRRAARAAQPGTRIEMAPGRYAGGVTLQNLHGEAKRPIVIAAADAENPPVITGGGVGLQLSQASYVELHDLILTGATGNGLNLDDGSNPDTPSHHIVLRGLKISNIGPRGNHDGIKLSGLDELRIENCSVENWGIAEGSGIDMVGCHHVKIENNVFCHNSKADESGAHGVQAKSGCRDILIRRNRFEHAGARAVNMGGGTRLQYFRPPLNRWPADLPKSEAADVRVEGNTFIGSAAPVAFVGVDGAQVRFNTFYEPTKWALRILQETTAPGFVPSRNGVFSDNIVAFRSAQWFERGVNISPGTDPKSFQFARNFWFCLNDPSRSRPRLPTPETNGIYAQDPLLRDADAGDLRLQPDSPALKMGAEALPQDPA